MIRMNSNTVEVIITIKWNRYGACMEAGTWLLKISTSLKKE